MDEADLDHQECPVCGCCESIPMGSLGSEAWFRCRACGVNFSDGGVA